MTFAKRRKAVGSLVLALGVLVGEIGADPPSVDRPGDPLPPGATARLGATRFRTAAAAVALSPDGRTLLTVTGGRTVGRWDSDTGRLREEVHIPGPIAHEVWLSPDGRTLASGEMRGLGLWDTATGKRLHALPVKPMQAAFSPDGRRLATADYLDSVGRIRLWDLTTGKDRLLAELPSYANDLAFAPDGKRLFAAVDNHSLRCFDVAGLQLWQNDYWAGHLDVSPDGRTLCTSAYLEGPLRLWDAATGKADGEPLDNEKHWTVKLAFSPDGKTIARATPQGVTLWDVASRKIRHELSQAGPHLAFAADGRSLFTAGPVLERWDVRTGKPLYEDARAGGHVGPVSSLAFAPDGRTLASSGADGTLRLWTPADGKHRVLRPDGPVGGGWIQEANGRYFVGSSVPLEFTPDGRLLFSDVAMGAVGLTDAASGKEVRRFTLPAPKDGWVGLTSARLTADGRTVLALGQIGRRAFSSIDLEGKEPFRAWDAATGREVLSGEVSRVSVGGAFAPDGRLLFLGHPPRLRDLRGRGEVGLEAVPGNVGGPLAVSPDGRLLAAAETGDPTLRAVRVCESLSGRQLVRLELDVSYGKPFAFSPDSRLLTVVGTDALHVYDPSTGRRLLHLEARGRVRNWNPARFACCLAFAPDGRSLATGHDDGSILIWDLTPALKSRAAPADRVDVATSWEDLASDDPATAYAAVERLVVTPREAVKLVREQVKPERVDAVWLTRRVADLDDASFARREAATRDLERIAEATEAELRRALEGATAAEVRKRLRQVLDTLDGSRAAFLSTEEARRLRALLVLERIASAESRAVLRELAGGAADARLTREARVALGRMPE